MDADIPEDLLVVEILSRLPLKSLLRLRSVSKSWATLIGTPGCHSRSLINDRLLSNPNHQLLFLQCTRRGRLSYSFLCYDTLASASETLHQDLPLQSPYDIYISSCNGLLCLFDSYNTGKIVVWNPITAEFRPILPHALNVETVCFGFDPIREDFKVLRIRYVVRVVEQHFRPYRVGRCLRLNKIVEVYSLSRDSWRNLVVDAELPQLQGLGLYNMNSVCFWLAFSCPGGDCEKVVAFYVCDEVFRTTALPNSSLCCYENPKTLTVLKELVALMVIPRKTSEGPGRFLDIWVLLEFGVRESWIRLLRIEHSRHFSWPLGFWKKGEFFLERERDLVLYDPFTQTGRTLQLDLDGYLFQVLPFTRSSVGINGSRFLDL